MKKITPNHKIVSPEEWLVARKELLRKEKEFTRLRDQLSAERRELPWVKVEKQYIFEGPDGKESLADLFNGRGQLIVYHFMFGPGWEEGCKSCSFLSDHFDGMTVHLNARDVSMSVVSRAPFNELQAFEKRMGWHFKWVSSGKVYYNYGLQEFPSEEAPGISVFYKDEAGNIYHTYSSYERGLDMLMGTYNYLDLVPKGRDEDDLTFTMAWVRHHDRYEDINTIKAKEKPVTFKGSKSSRDSKDRQS